jgi:DNA polymerase III alpha subunit
MEIDKFGAMHRTADELCNLLYSDPQLDLHQVEIDDPDDFNRAVKELFYDFGPLQKYYMQTGSIDEFDSENQKSWYMPESYKVLDIAKYVLDQCQTDEELQRVGEELLMYQDRNLLDLLRFMKYFVDHLREHNIVWGVGRGSSTASYVLFLIGVHRINSIYYDLDIAEFLK